MDLVLNTLPGIITYSTNPSVGKEYSVKKRVDKYWP